MEQEGTKADAIGTVVRAFVPWTLEAAIRKLEDTERNMEQDARPDARATDASLRGDRAGRRGDARVGPGSPSGLSPYSAR